MKNLKHPKNNLKFLTGIMLLSVVNQITAVYADNSNNREADGFGGFIALFSIGFLAFMAPRLRRESLEDTK